MEQYYKSKKNNSSLLAYSSLATAFILASAGITQAQVNLIEYTDVDPDLTFDSLNNSYELDMNNDGSTDFNLQIYTHTYVPIAFSTGTVTLPANLLFIKPTAGNSVAGTLGSTATYAYPFALDNGSAINAAQTWQNLDIQSLVYSVYGYTSGGSRVQVLSQGDFFGGVTDKFLGLKFKVSGDTYYGWLRLNVAGDNKSFTVKDYAYNTVADMGIDAGQQELIGTGVNNTIDPSKINTYSFGNTIYISTNNLDAKNAEVKVFDATGQVVFSDALQSVMNIQLNNANGIYMLCITADGAKYNKEVFILADNQR